MFKVEFLEGRPIAGLEERLNEMERADVERVSGYQTAAFNDVMDAFEERDRRERERVAKLETDFAAAAARIRELEGLLRAWGEASLRYYPPNFAFDMTNPASVIANIVGPATDIRIRELEAQLAEANQTIADLRDFAYNRAPKIAAEEADRQKAELEAQLAEANALTVTQRGIIIEHEKAAVRIMDEYNAAETKWTARASRLEAALRAYPEWVDDDDPQAVGTMQRFVTCLICGGGGAFNGDGKPSNRIPPTHNPDCVRQLALGEAEGGEK